MSHKERPPNFGWPFLLVAKFKNRKMDSNNLPRFSSGFLHLDAPKCGLILTTDNHINKFKYILGV